MKKSINTLICGESQVNFLKINDQMTNYILYISALLIFIFVLAIAFRAIRQGMDAKSENFQKEKEIIKEQNNSMSNELEKITNLYNKGSLTEEE